MSIRAIERAANSLEVRLVDFMARLLRYDDLKYILALVEVYATEAAESTQTLDAYLNTNEARVAALLEQLPDYTQLMVRRFRTDSCEGFYRSLRTTHHRFTIDCAERILTLVTQIFALYSLKCPAISKDEFMKNQQLLATVFAGISF